MKIGIDARSLCGNLTGIGRYVYETANAITRMSDDFEFYYYCAPNYPTNALPDASKVRISNAPRQISAKLIFDHYCKKDNIDIYWAAQTLLPATRNPAYKTVCTVHDLNHIIEPKTMSLISRISHKLFFEDDVKRANRIVCNSQGTSDRLKELIGINSDAIAKPGISKIFHPCSKELIFDVLHKYGIKSRYFLSVATQEPRKNLALLIDSYIELRKSYASEIPDLVLVGGRGWGVKSRHYGYPGIQYLGYIPDDDLSPLYNGATAFVFPSRYEGFGMPAAEAAACGTPVIASNIPEIREAAGSSGIYIQPNKESLMIALKETMNLVRPAPIVANTWEDCAERYIEVFNSLR